MMAKKTSLAADGGGDDVGELDIRRAMSIADVAQRLRCSVRTAYRVVAGLPHFRVRGRRWLLPEELDAYIRRCRETP